MTIKEMQERKRELGYTYAQIAELSGIPAGTVQKVLGGITLTPRYETLMALEKVLGSDTADSWPEMVREAQSVYGVKRQGMYDLDDYYALPDDVRAELIDGVIYDMGMPSTVHQYLITKICHAIYSYIEEKGGHCMVFPASPGVQIDCDDRSMLVPDLVVPMSEHRTFKYFKEESLQQLSEDAFIDPCTGGNPKKTSVAEILEIYKKAY